MYNLCVDSWTFLLSDNGSRRAAAAELLASRARDLGERVGVEVHPVPLFHSPSDDVLTLSRYLSEQYSRGRHRFAVLPLFLGPSRALSRGIPRILDELRPDCPELVVEVGAPLYREEEEGGGALADLLESAVRDQLGEGPPPPVVLVDHGSPAPAVTAVRDRLAACLHERLGSAVQGVAPASMERRPGPEYAFSDPLLEDILREPAYTGEVVLSMLFLGPGRHAGPGGDVDQILEDLRRDVPTQRVRRTTLVGEHPGLVDLLARRFQELRSRL